MKTQIFEEHYENYCRQIAEIDFFRIKDTLCIEHRGQEVVIPFLGEHYIVSQSGVKDESGKRPNYMICVILAKYLLMCPDAPVLNKEWCTLKELRRMSQFTNINVFTSDTEKPIVKHYSGRINALVEASRKLGGKSFDMSTSYDFAYEFMILPRIETLLVFNDGDDEFPATCSLLFQKQAEHYLDPESLIMAGIVFAKHLKAADAMAKK